MPKLRTVKEIRKILRARDKCADSCPGFMPSDVGIGIEVCEDCRGVNPSMKGMWDDEVAQLPEAKKVLRAYDAKEWD